MYRKEIKANFMQILKCDEENYFFYPKSALRPLAIMAFFLCSFFLFVFLFLIDFQWNLYLLLFIFVYTIGCLFLFYKSFSMVWIQNGKITVKYFFMKRVHMVEDIEYILRETKRISLPSTITLRANTARQIFYYFQLPDGKQILLASCGEEPLFEKYEASLEKKIDAFMKLVGNDYGIETIFQDIDFQKQEEENDIRADFIKKMFCLENTEEKKEQKVADLKRRKEEKRRVQKKNIIFYSVFSFLSGISFIVNIVKHGFHYQSIIGIFVILFLVYLVYDNFHWKI